GLTACRVTETTGPATHDILSSARGLFNGTVKQIHDDPKGHYRILVDLPLPGALSAGIWARPANFYATSGAGAFFLPEVGDEVVVGFLNEDPRYPIILGSLYSNPEHKPHASLVPDEQNSLKAIVSKSGLTVSFDDKDKILSISSPGMNTIVVNDKEKEISIKDQHANSIVMSTDGIAINSLKDIKIGAGGIISINGTGNIGITSKADVTVSALNISETANVGYTAKGTTSAEVSASGQVSIKGAMVMIN
ncbi:MAG: type secretion protein Rhs, partial [Flavipsychrobacter sp.]|nr:type secretion protein Rhs [Flavipsychrobacter sp.]